MDLNCH